MRSGRNATWALIYLLSIASVSFARVRPSGGTSGPSSPTQPSSKATAVRTADVPTLAVGVLDTDIRIDGRLDEPVWRQADAIQDLTMIEPTEGGIPTGRTIVRVLANARAIVFGVECDDPDPARIVSYTKQRDGEMISEDHIEIVLDTFLDGCSGYVFWVNPGGARYDALINPGGGDVNSNWDGIWEAATNRTEKGWTVEIRIPLQTLSFKKGSTAWHPRQPRAGYGAGPLTTARG